jgi:hypothetical protein
MGRTVSFSVSGSTARTSAFLKKMQSPDIWSGLNSLGARGVTALAANTPKESGLTAASWSYEVEIKNGVTTISWVNANRQNGVNVAIILQYGHGTGTGGYVAGRDYINPAIQPIFDDIANEMWKKVTSS